MKELGFSSFSYPCQTSQAWRRFGVRGTLEGGAAATGCCGAMRREPCALPAPHAGRCCSPGPSCCHSRTWQSNFLGCHAAVAFCTKLLSPVKLYFPVGLTSVLGGAMGPSDVGRGELGAPAPAPIPAGPHPPPPRPRRASSRDQPLVVGLAAEMEGVLFTVALR